jgi:hypothetical protein
METAMKTIRFHGPLRFGSRWRGHELLLRLCQVMVFALVAVVGGQLVVQLIRFVVRAAASY